MSKELHSELKKEFQLERMILFSDAVFAIAITLLVLEIRVPEVDRHTATDAQLGHMLGELIPRFIGFLVSFFIIGLYWTIHHRMFGYVVNYTPGLLWLNLFFLFAVVLMPFSTAFYSVFVLRYLHLPVIIYVINLVLLGLMHLILWRYVSSPKRKLVEGLSRLEKKYYTIRAITAPAVFIVMALVYLFVEPQFAVWIPAFTPLVVRLVSRKFRKKIAFEKKMENAS